MPRCPPSFFSSLTSVYRSRLAPWQSVPWNQASWSSLPCGRYRGHEKIYICCPLYKFLLWKRRTTLSLDQFQTVLSAELGQAWKGRRALLWPWALVPFCQQVPSFDRQQLSKKRSVNVYQIAYSQTFFCCCDWVAACCTCRMCCWTFDDLFF